VRVTFLLTGEEDLDALRVLDPDREDAALQRGERAWVLQTYLRLARAGHPVELAAVAPREGAVVFHVKQRRALLRNGGPGRAVLVGIRADNRTSGLSDFEVVQNGCFADDRRYFFIPFWPQPALVPRDDARGDRVERICFKGFLDNLDPAFREPSLMRALAERGVVLDLHGETFRHAGGKDLHLSWGDYSNVDLVLAVRPHDRRLHTSKPASKLINAWHARVPALLGPEYAYRELRRNALDYLEVSTPPEALAAIDRLQREPALYRAMVENGRLRAERFTLAAVLERWVKLLYQALPTRLALRGAIIGRRVPLPVRWTLREAVRLACLRPTR
jgi:hypothetical protein